MLFVWWNGHIDPASIDLGATIDLLVIAVVGGLYRLEGAWVGALFFVIINNYSQRISFIGPRFHTLIGAIFLVIVLVSPGGLVGLWERVSTSSPGAAVARSTGRRSGSARPSPASERRLARTTARNRRVGDRPVRMHDPGSTRNHKAQRRAKDG